MENITICTSADPNSDCEVLAKRIQMWRNNFGSRPAPLIFESIFERLAKRIYSIGKINSIFWEIDPAKYQALI